MVSQMFEGKARSLSKKTYSKIFDKLVKNNFFETNTLAYFTELAVTKNKIVL